MYVDSHAHLTSDEVYPEIEQVLVRAQEARVSKVINICTDLETLERGLKIHQSYGWVSNTAATTPHDVDQWGELHFDSIAEAAKRGDLVAIGETGLDYHYEHSNKETQKEFLRRYAQLATLCKLPLVIHCREAFADLFSILDKEYQGPCILHCFTGTLAEAKGVIERGWYLSLSGIVTFKKSENLREVAKWVPLEQLLIETDAPYLAPNSKRGKQNEPAYLPETAQVIADLKGISLEALASQTSQNSEKVFNL